jgi:Na+/H+ antiporter NhaD/arsenite permease-like protein
MLPILSLAALGITIVLGFWTGVNIGVISAAFAFIVGFFLGGMEPASIYLTGWPVGLFFMLTGMTLLFGIAKLNGTFAVLAKQIASFSFGSRKLTCLIMYVISAAVSMAGVGTIVTPAILMPLILEIAREEDIPENLAILLCIAGSIGGGLSPIAPTGIVGVNLGLAVGLESYAPIFKIALCIFSIHGALFFFIFGGWRLKKKPPKPRPAFALDSKQIATMIVIGAVIGGVLFLKYNLGLMAFTGAAALLALNAADQKETIASVPWPTLMMICGVSLLVNVISESGGITLMSDYLTKIMSVRSAPAIMNVLGGLLSMVSSASGVVMPALIPTVPGIISKLGDGVSVTQLTAAIIIGAHVVPYSPLSTLGAIGMAASTERSDRDKLFAQLLASAVGMLAFTSLLIWFGLLNIFG